MDATGVDDPSLGIPARMEVAVTGEDLDFLRNLDLTVLVRDGGGNTGPAGFTHKTTLATVSVAPNGYPSQMGIGCSPIRPLLPSMALRNNETGIGGDGCNQDCQSSHL